MNQKNNVLAFVKLIINNSEKNSAKSNMTKEQKKEYIYKRLFEYFERGGMKLDEIIPIYQEAYQDFIKEDFIQYVITHTSNTDIVFEEKLKLEKKIEKISDEIDKINIQLGGNDSFSDFEKRFRRYQQERTTIDEKIEQIKKKYQLSANMIGTKYGLSLRSEQLQEYIELIEDMVNGSSSVEELYTMAKEQIVFFSGMGTLYEKELRKRSPKLFEYIDSLIQNEVAPLMEQKQRLEQRKKELVKLKVGLSEICAKYDKRLPTELRGTKQEREQRKENERRKAEERRRQEERMDYYRRYDSGGCGSSGCGGGGC